VSAVDQRRRGGFSLLEVLVALGVLVTVMGIVGAALVSTINGWDRGQRALDGMRRGEHVMDQLANALRSTAAGGASTKRGVYAFQISNTEGNPPLATLSWVTSSGAFLPPGSPLIYGLHRIALSIEQMDDGRSALAVRAWPYLMDDPDLIDSIEPGFLAPDISGLSCRVYDYQRQDWQTEWASSNAVPALVEINVYVNSETNAEPLQLQRLIEMPLGVTNVNDTIRIEMNPFAPSSGSSEKKGSKGSKDSGRGRSQHGSSGLQAVPQSGSRSR
jgi:hypothetical protein